MNELRITNFEELHEALSKYRKNNIWIFRGQGDSTWDLIPKAGRYPYRDSNDKSFFDSWKRRAVDYLSFNNDDDWSYLSSAQHHGLATRLLDWTFNPLVAAFFSVSEDLEGDGIIYAYLDSRITSIKDIEPFKCNGIKEIKPNGINRRLIQQSGIFTIHNPPTLDLKDNVDYGCVLEKIIIDKSYKKELLFELSHYGFNNLSLFPDLDGLSRHVNWYMENSNYWKEEIK